jgi:RNA 2',3'-cyclic 3'-phosphodiesterase
MRTFIAIGLPEEIGLEISRLTSKLAEHFPGVRWSRPENIHLTLRFLGEIDENRLEDLKAAVERAAVSVAPLELTVAQVGCFGPQRSPRVIWLGLRESEPLGSLAAFLEKELVAAGFGVADKPFKAHLTLARIKNPLRRPPDWERIQGLGPETWPAWEATEVLIIRSTLLPEGPVYETLAACALKG